jgi:hypothetical protein
MNVREWLKASEQFLSKEDLEAVRAKAKENLAREHAEVLAKAAQLEADLKEFEAGASALVESVSPPPPAPPVTGPISAPVAPTPANLNGPREPEETIYVAHDEDLGSLSIDTIAIRYIESHPGTTVGHIMAFAKKARPDVNPEGVYGSLSRLSAAGRVRKQGERTNARYHPKED